MCVYSVYVAFQTWKIIQQKAREVLKVAKKLEHMMNNLSPDIYNVCNHQSVEIKLFFLSTIIPFSLLTRNLQIKSDDKSHSYIKLLIKKSFQFVMQDLRFSRGCELR
jgi:UDP-2,3-diacylglucosamine pyrophosphatase LpxH